MIEVCSQFGRSLPDDEPCGTKRVGEVRQRVSGRSFDRPEWESPGKRGHDQQEACDDSNVGRDERQNRRDDQEGEEKAYRNCREENRVQNVLAIRGIASAGP